MGYMRRPSSLARSQPIPPSDVILNRFAGDLPQDVCQLIVMEANAPGMTVVNELELPALLRNGRHSGRIGGEHAKRLGAPILNGARRLNGLDGARQEAVFGRSLPVGAITLAVGERALRDNAMHPDRLEHALALSMCNPGVVLRILPEMIRLPHAFTVFPEGVVGAGPAVFVEQADGGMQRDTRPEAVAAHAKMAADALLHAYSAEDSQALLAEMIVAARPPVPLEYSGERSTMPGNESSLAVSHEPYDAQAGIVIYPPQTS